MGIKIKVVRYIDIISLIKLRKKTMTEQETTMTEQETESKSGAIWNPSATVNWSLMFTPAFGAFLQAKNWQTLGENKRAKYAMIWFYISVLITVGGALSNHHEANLGFLFLWYFFAAKSQVTYVKEKFGNAYERRSWHTPLKISAPVLGGLILLIFVLEAATENLVKKGTLALCPNATVEKMAQNFMESPVWSSGVTSSGQHFVNLKGNILFNNKKVESLIQFFVDQEQGTFQLNVVEIDKILQTDIMAITLLGKMCENAHK